MSRRKTWLCDFEDCTNTAEYYRRVSGKVVKLCLHHDVHMRKQRLGVPVDYKNLTSRETQFLENKEFEHNFECLNCHATMIVLEEDLLDRGIPRCPKCNALMQQF